MNAGRIRCARDNDKRRGRKFSVPALFYAIGVEYQWETRGDTKNRRHQALQSGRNFPDYPPKILQKLTEND
ncbi:MAG: hypothetical protein LBS52_03220 [Dysgonamonadaceae bacterium]|nr:hypothetical protein [Dysgonamonadaceae bacterium]